MNMADNRIVVGADGSELSVSALRWAARQAELTDAELLVVTGYDIPATIWITPTYTEEDYARDAERLLEHTVSKAFEESPCQVPMRTALLQEKPALALASISEGARLLVIGSQGQGELPGMHLGSVASYCVHHAPCPVLIYRHQDD